MEALHVTVAYLTIAIYYTDRVYYYITQVQVGAIVKPHSNSACELLRAESLG